MKSQKLLFVGGAVVAALVLNMTGVINPNQSKMIALGFLACGVAKA